MVTSVRPDRRVSTIIACVAVAVAAFAGINVFHAFGPIHLSNDGPLSGIGGGFAFDADTPGPWTAGYELCVQRGTDTVILESVTPASPSGAGLRWLGAFVRPIPASGGAIGTAPAFHRR
jgi:hypothetical protein